MDTGTADSGEVAPAAPQPSHINVHIHKESVLAKILLSGCSLLWLSATTSQTLDSSRLLVASWVVQIVLGLMSGVLGGFLYISVCMKLCTSGAALWTGAAAVLAGAAAFVYDKRGGISWALLRTLLSLAAFCTATAALAIGASSFHEYRYDMNTKYICKDYSRDWPTLAPTTGGPESEQLQLCVSQMNMVKGMFMSLQSMLVGIWVLLLLASLVPLGLYCWRRFAMEQKRDRGEEAPGREPALVLPLLGTHT